MILALSFLLANFAVCEIPGGERICDSFIRDGVTPKDFERLTAKSRAGRTHLECFGTGFFVTEDGCLLTNHHVVDAASEIVVVRNATAYYADVKMKNAKKDLALLKINLFPRSTNGVFVTTRTPKVAALPFAENLEVGETVYVVGFPETDVLGHEVKLSRGIVNSVSGFRDRKDLFQLDAAITHGNSGGPVMNESGAVVGVASYVTGLVGGNYNWAIRYDVVRDFLAKSMSVRHEAGNRRMKVSELAKKSIASTVLVLVYKEGACERVTSTDVDIRDVDRREREVCIKQSILNARLYKLRKEWESLLKVTDGILNEVGDYEDARALNELARDELGLHLEIIAEADGKDVEAMIVPVAGFKESVVVCGKPTALFGGSERRGFPVEARLEYEDSEWIWRGELKCRYTWQGTKKMRISLHHVGKK